jgi:hypothetical protein
LNGHWWGRGEKRRGKCDQNILKMLIKSKKALKKKNCEKKKKKKKKFVAQ